MPSGTIDFNDLLEYKPDYRVLICRACQYAIQKSALQSHLLRHKIYRGERQRLLAYIAQLDLLEPHLVPLPEPTSSPIDALPTISGFCCTAVGCGNLCESSKRMRHHWIKNHSSSGPPPSFFRQAKLQTFFRGTKVKYFEVLHISPTKTDKPGQLITATEGDEAESGKYVKVARRHEDQRRNTVATDSRPVFQVKSLPRSPLPEFDLETLTYFHHFITTTSLTLPGSGVENYWQVKFVHQALNQRWLMCGLLAISAYHLVALESDLTTRCGHLERLQQLSSDFTAEYEEKRNDGSHVGIQNIIEKASGRLRCILLCASLASSDSQELAVPLQLHSIMSTIREFIAPDFPTHVCRNEETFAEARRILDTEVSSDIRRNKTPPSMLDYLRALPDRMSDTFGKPESAEEFFATILAIGSLVKCCEISFTSDDPEAVWQGMATWLIEVPHPFHHMISNHRTMALVVLMHWTLFLVNRAENYGCWFLKGVTKLVVSHIMELLPDNDQAVQNLITTLVMFASTINDEPRVVV